MAQKARGEYPAWLPIVVGGVALLVGGFVASFAGSFAAYWVTGNLTAIIQLFTSAVVQDIATVIQAIFAVALVVVTILIYKTNRAITRATEIQVHSATAPIIHVTLYTLDEPATKRPQYLFGPDDTKQPEVNVWMVGAVGPERYIILRATNTQTQGGAYNFAAEVSVQVALEFRRHAAVAGAAPGQPDSPESWYVLSRKIETPILLGGETKEFSIFRVDPLPGWTATVQSINYKDFKGKDRTMAVGHRILARDEHGNETTQFYVFQPSPGELPR